MTSQYAVVLFYSTSYALRAEKVLARAGIDCKLIPVPRHLSSDCGVSVRITAAEQGPALKALDEAGVEFERLHEI